MTKLMEIEVIQHSLKEVIAGLKPDEEILIVQDRKLVAKLVASSARQRRQPGMLKGMLSVVSEDDEHLEDFKDFVWQDRNISPNWLTRMGGLVD